MPSVDLHEELQKRGIPKPAGRRPKTPIKAREAWLKQKLHEDDVRRSAPKK